MIIMQNSATLSKQCHCYQNCISYCVIQSILCVLDRFFDALLIIISIHCQLQYVPNIILFKDIDFSFVVLLLKNYKYIYFCKILCAYLMLFMDRQQLHLLLSSHKLVHQQDDCLHIYMQNSGNQTKLLIIKITSVSNNHLNNNTIKQTTHFRELHITTM